MSDNGLSISALALVAPLNQIGQVSNPASLNGASIDSTPIRLKGNINTDGPPLALQGIRLKVCSELNKLTPSADKCADTGRINSVDNSVVVLGHSLATSYLWIIH